MGDSGGVHVDGSTACLAYFQSFSNLSSAWKDPSGREIRYWSLPDLVTLLFTTTFKYFPTTYDESITTFNTHKYSSQNLIDYFSSTWNDVYTKGT